MEQYQEKLESDKELIDILKFLIKDQAFQEEFLVTILLEYVAKSRDIK